MGGTQLLGGVGASGSSVHGGGRDETVCGLPDVSGDRVPVVQGARAPGEVQVRHGDSAGVEGQGTATRRLTVLGSSFFVLGWRLRAAGPAVPPCGRDDTWQWVVT